MKNTKHKKNTIPGMDGLRAMAAISVFFVHYNQLAGLEYTVGEFDLTTFMANGEHGVAFFFSLSGFLLSLPFWKALLQATRMPAVTPYFIRRVARIMPAYYVLLTVLILLGQLWKIPGAWVDIVSHYLFVFNMADFTIYSISPQFWTLAVEWQFYCLMPLFFWGIHTLKLNRHVLIYICFLIIACCMVQHSILETFDKVISWPFQPLFNWIRPHGAVLTFSLPACLPHFLLGIYAGWVYIRISQNKLDKHFIIIHAEKIFWVCSALIVSMLSTQWHDSITWSAIPYGFPLIPILITFMIITLPFTRYTKNLFELTCIKKLGHISYGIYLYHYACLILTAQWMNTKGLDAADHWLMFGFAGFLATLILATASYTVIEKPFLRLVRWK